jgi:P pilus assembly chaperone PapD
MRYKVFVIIILAVMLLVIFNFEILAAVRVEPARIIINSKLNTRSTGIIEVINNGEEQMLLQAFLYDWTLNDRDGLITYEPGTLDTSLGEYIKFNPRSFIIDPGKKQIVRFTLTTPESLDKELRGVVFFEHETDYVDESTGAKVKTQLGTVIYLIPENAKYNFKLNEVRFSTGSDKDMHSSLLIMENNGSAHLRFSINYKIIDINSNLIEEDRLDNNVLLPGFQRGLIFNFNQKLASGDYKLILTYNFFNNDKQSDYEIPFTVK